MKKFSYMKEMEGKKTRGEIILVAGVGSGITARAASLGGADFLATYNTAVYRMQGLSTALAFLPYDDCNSIAFACVPQVLAGALDKPVLLGLGAHDPRQPASVLIKKAQDVGAAGVTNEPFIGMYGGDLQKQLEAAGLGFDRELELIGQGNKAGMFTLGWVFRPNEAVRMANAGADMIGIMTGGVTSGGNAGGAKTVTVDNAVRSIAEIMEAIVKTGCNTPALIHGGPLNGVEAVREVFNRTNAAGYVTGSTGERIPTEIAVRQTISEFKSIRKGEDS